MSVRMSELVNRSLPRHVVKVADEVPELDMAQRFTERAEEYVRYRPSYPAEVVNALEREAGVSPLTRVVDIGCGTGISSALFLERNYTVTGIEPSAAMRQAASAWLGASSRFSVIEGAAERVPLPDACCGLIIVAQAFHWFDVDAARAEMERLLEDGGVVALVWNVRRTDSSAFLSDFERILRDRLPEYARRQATPDGEVSRLFGANGFSQRVFENHQDVDLNGLIGRAMSLSYFPRPGELQHASLCEALTVAFEKHAVAGKVRLEQDAFLYFGRLSKLRSG